MIIYSNMSAILTATYLLVLIPLIACHNFDIDYIIRVAEHGFMQSGASYQFYSSNFVSYYSFNSHSSHSSYSNSDNNAYSSFSQWNPMYSKFGSSLAPTNYPAIVPTLAPTQKPTLKPTLPPSMQPTSYPAIVPTLVPTLKPTQNPTLTPSTLPTNYPAITPTALEYTTTFAFNDYPTPTLSLADENALIMATALSMNISVNYISVWAPNNRRLIGYNIQTILNIIIPLINQYANINPTLLYTSLVNELTTAVSTGNFNMYLKAAAIAYNSTSMAAVNVTTSVLTVSPPIVTNTKQPTSVPTAYPTLYSTSYPTIANITKHYDHYTGKYNEQTLIIIIVVLFPSIALGILAYYLHYAIKTKEIADIELSLNIIPDDNSSHIVNPRSVNPEVEGEESSA